MRPRNRRLFQCLASLSVLAALSGCGDLSLTSGLVPGYCLGGFNTERAGDAYRLQDNLTELAQSFRLDSSGAPDSVKIKLQAVGAPSGLLILKVEGDQAGGGPNGIPLGTATIDAASPLDQATHQPKAADYYRFTFSPALSLTKGTTYWLRLKGNGLNLSNAIEWIGNNTGAYSAGSVATSTNGTTWSTPTGGSGLDLLFLLGC